MFHKFSILGFTVRAAPIRKLRITSVTPYYRRRPGFPLDADSGDASVDGSL